MSGGKTDSGDAYWRSMLSDGEVILWTAAPSADWFPPRLGWIYRLVLAGFVVFCALHLWEAAGPRDLLGPAILTLAVFGGWWAERTLRAQRAYVITSDTVWEMNRLTKSKHLAIDRFLQFRQTRFGVSFDHHPFFVLDHIADPQRAFTALKHAQEART